MKIKGNCVDTSLGLPIPSYKLTVDIHNFAQLIALTFHFADKTT